LQNASGVGALTLSCPVKQQQQQQKAAELGAGKHNSHWRFVPAEGAGAGAIGVLPCSFVYKLRFGLQLFACIPCSLLSSLLVIRESEILCGERTAWLVLFLLVFFHFRKKICKLFIESFVCFFYIDVYILIIKWF